MPIPNIDHDVQRCRKFIKEIQTPFTARGLNANKSRAMTSVSILPHLAAVLAELERLREVEEDEGLEARFADTDS